MKILVIGGGGREHALAWKLKQSEGVSQVFVAPGNAGTALDKQLVNLALTDTVALREWAQAEGIALTVVGPEAPLAAGVVDEFRAHGLAIFGPTRPEHFAPRGRRVRVVLAGRLEEVDVAQVLAACRALTSDGP